MKITRLVIIALVALILSAPATAAISPDGRQAPSAGDLLDFAGQELANVVTELR